MRIVLDYGLQRIDAASTVERGSSWTIKSEIHSYIASLVPSTAGLDYIQ